MQRDVYAYPTRQNRLRGSITHQTIAARRCWLPAESRRKGGKRSILVAREMRSHVPERGEDSSVKPSHIESFEPIVLQRFFPRVVLFLFRTKSQAFAAYRSLRKKGSRDLGNGGTELRRPQVTHRSPYRVRLARLLHECIGSRTWLNAHCIQRHNQMHVKSWKP